MGLGDLWASRRQEKAQVAVHDNSSNEDIQDGDLQYTRDVGKNGTAATYQEASGAPVEIDSPLGYQINWFTVIFLNVGQMVGTGVFSTRKCVLSVSDSRTDHLSHSRFHSQSFEVRRAEFALLAYRSFDRSIGVCHFP
jgi:hypothetical protein